MSLNDPSPRIPRGKRMTYAVVAAVLMLVLAETVVSWAATGVSPSVYWVYEDTGPRTRFDPISGYRTYGGPARVAKFVRSRNPFRSNLEYVGGFRGNADGFPDRDDFRAERAGDGAARLAVLGDSFTGGDLVLHWPDACEDEVRHRGGRAELLNFSLSGIGLGNWHSILTKEIEPRGYQLDGVVFAVWDNDLARRFYVCDHEGSERRLGGRVDSWDPAVYPKTRTDALRYMSSWQGWIVSRDEFESAVHGQWQPERPFRPFLANAVIDLFTPSPPDGGRVGAAAPRTLHADLADTSKGRGRLVREMKETLDRMGVPVTVVRIPTIEELLEPRLLSPQDDARAFAKFLGARFLDGSRAFAGLEAREIRAHWYPVDLHWNQSGSDRFARWMADEIERWPTVQGSEMRVEEPAGRRTGAR